MIEYAHVFGNARVCGSAKISGKTRVTEYAYLFGNACVFENAWVCGNAWVMGNAEVSGYVHVSGNAEISGDARISKIEDYFCAQAFGSRGRTTTFFKEKHGWRIKCGCFSGTIEEFRKKVKETHSDSLIAQEYLLIADLMELRIKRIETEG